MKKNPPSSTDDLGSIPRGAKIAHALGQLSLAACHKQLQRSPWATMKDPACCNEDPSCHS